MHRTRWLGRTALWVHAVLLTGCAATGNTLAQELAWERAEKCKGGVAGIQITRVESDGRIWYQSNDSSEGSQFSNCLRQAEREQAQRRVVAAPPPPVATTATASTSLPGPTTGIATSASIPIPTWRIGDEWAYRNEQPDRDSTFVWSVDDIERLDGVEHYVVKSSTRRIYYRTADGAITLQKVSGEVTNRYTPGWLPIAWPLTPGKKWENQFVEERIQARETENVRRECEVGAEETITVPAGTFTAIPIACRNQRNGALVYQYWYAPIVKHIVREVWQLTNGKRTRELIAYKLR
jgi:hypothetical protein